MKNVSRIKLLHCFRRPVVDDVMLDPRCRRNQLMHLLMDEGGNEKASRNLPGARSRKHSLSRMLKSALFNTALARSIRRKRSSSLRNLSLTKRCDSMDTEPRGLSRDDNDQKLINDQMNCYSSISPSSCSSSALEYVDPVSKPCSPDYFLCNGSSMKQEQNPDHQDQTRRKRARLDMACLLFICLMGTVLCGRTRAIVFALMWLLVVTRWLCRSVVDGADDDVTTGRTKKAKVLQVETDEKKRRKTGVQLIMEVLRRMCEGKTPKN